MSHCGRLCVSLLLFLYLCCHLHVLCVFVVVAFHLFVVILFPFCFLCIFVVVFHLSVAVLCHFTTVVVSFCH